MQCMFEFHLQNLFAERLVFSYTKSTTDHISLRYFFCFCFFCIHCDVCQSTSDMNSRSKLILMSMNMSCSVLIIMVVAGNLIHCTEDDRNAWPNIYWEFFKLEFCCWMLCVVTEMGREREWRGSINLPLLWIFAPVSFWPNKDSIKFGWRTILTWKTAVCADCFVPSTTEFVCHFPGVCGQFRRSLVLGSVRKWGNWQAHGTTGNKLIQHKQWPSYQMPALSKATHKSPLFWVPWQTIQFWTDWLKIFQGWVIKSFLFVAPWCLPLHKEL